MNQKLEDYLREWFRAGPRPDEPGSLHDFLAAVPLKHPRADRGRGAVPFMQPRRVLAGVAAALVVVVAGGTILFGLINRSNTPIAGGSPSPTATASAQPTSIPSGSNLAVTASPVPSLPAALANLPELTVPASVVKTANGVVLPTSQAYVSYNSGAVVSSQLSGSRYYLVDWTAVDATYNPTNTATAIIRYGDASTGSAGSVPLPLTQAELIGLRSNVGGGLSVTTDGSALAVVVWYRLGAPGQQGVPCISNAGAPMAWRILVAPIEGSTGAPGAFSPIATGRNRVAFMVQPVEGCPDVSPPVVSLSGGRIAYDVENATAGHPLASTIVVRSLAGGAPEREIATLARPIRLELAGTNVAWLEATDNPELPLQALPLRVSTATQPAPTNVDAMDPPDPEATSVPEIPRFSLVGDQIAWDRYGTGQVFLETVGSGSARQISPSGTSCLVGGSDAGHVMLLCGSDPWLTYTGGSLVIWSPTAGSQLLQGYAAGANGFSWLSNGWVVTQRPPGNAILSFFRLGDLTS